MFSLLLQPSIICFKSKINEPNSNNPGKPTVSAYSYPTELNSQCLDLIISTFVKSLPKYIKDTNHALKTFHDFYFFLGENKLILTMDTTSLYTVIRDKKGLLTLKYFIDQHATKHLTTETLICPAELVLTLVFQFRATFSKKLMYYGN